MSTIKYFQRVSNFTQLSQQYVCHKRYFAKKSSAARKLKSSTSTLSQLQTDKTTQEYLSILNWWKEKKQSRLDIESLSNDLKNEFIQKREIYKKNKISRINKMKNNIDIAINRKKDALNALPPRLSFISQITTHPSWENDLHKNIKHSYTNLHNNGNIEASLVNKLNISNNKYYNINKLRYKTKDEINELEKQRLSNKKIYNLPTSSLDYYPQLYDPGDIRTQPSYVRSFFDYQWKPGMTIPIKEKKQSVDPDAHLLEDQVREIYGKDYSGIQLSRIIDVEGYTGGGGIGGAEQLTKKLQQEQEGDKNEPKKQKKMNQEEKAQESFRLQKIREQKEKVRSSVKDWEKSIIGPKNKKDGDDKDASGGSGGGSGKKGKKDKKKLEEQKQREDAARRIEERAKLSDKLPSIEALLVNKELNKDFFENKLPYILNHESTGEDRKQECIKLVRKYTTVQTHVGYGVR